MGHCGDLAEAITTVYLRYTGTQMRHHDPCLLCFGGVFQAC